MQALKKSNQKGTSRELYEYHIQYRDDTNDKSKEENNTAPFRLLLGFDKLFYLVFIWNYLNGNFGGDFLKLAFAWFLNANLLK